MQRLVAASTGTRLQGSRRATGRFELALDNWREWIDASVVIGILLAAIVLWVASLPAFDLRSMTDLGLISVAPQSLLASLGLIAMAFALSLRLRQGSVPLAMAAIVLVVLTIHSLPAYVEGPPRFPVTYLHAGFTDVAAHGQLLPLEDARFSWPLFFTWGALLTTIAGIPNAIAMAPWFPTISNLAYLVPLIVIYRALTLDWRLIATASFVFMATNWIGQDYYSPQGFNYLLYLTVLAIVLRWFPSGKRSAWVSRVEDWVRRHVPGLRAPSGAYFVDPPPTPPATTASQRVGLVAILVVLVAVSVASHQLTPFAILAALSALVLIGSMQLRGLPVMVAVLTGMWISYMTVAFLSGHLANLLSDLGAPGQTASASVGQRLIGSPLHVFVVQWRLVFTLLFWALAGLGALRRFRRGNLVDVEVVSLAVIPFGLLLLQAYGGEILLRVYLFSLPFMAFLAAGFFFPARSVGNGRGTSLALTAFAAIALVSLMVTKHGNERADYVTAAELAAVDHLYAIAPEGSKLASITSSSPLRYVHYADYAYPTVEEPFYAHQDTQIHEALASPDQCAYLFVSRMQQASAEVYAAVTPQAWSAAEAAMLRGGGFIPIFANEDAQIYLIQPGPPGCPRGSP